MRVALELPSPARLRGPRAAARRRARQRVRLARPAAARRPLDPRRLRAAVLPREDRGPAPVRPRRVRRQGRPRRAGHGGRAPARRGREPRRPSVRGRRGARQRRGRGGRRALPGAGLPRERRADRRPPRPRHARRAPADPAGRGPGRALVAAAARRVGDRQAARRARGAAVDRAAGGPRAGPDVLLDRPHLGRRRPERHLARRLRRGAVPNDRPRQGHPRPARSRWAGSSRSRRCSKSRRCGCAR